MHFTKMEGLGNDYVYVNCFEEKINDPQRLAQAISDRHFGIGSDGLILICPSEKADARMLVYNSDGSQAEMCGNGIRCVGKYLYDNRIADNRRISIETLAGIKQLVYVSGNQCESRIMVDMGRPLVGPDKRSIVYIRTKHDEMGSALNAHETFGIEESIYRNGRTYPFARVSMGNPHAVVLYPDSLQNCDVRNVGMAMENEETFPDGVNVEFVRVRDSRTVQMRVWERGSGETMACGTGACAAAAVCMVLGYTEDEIMVQLNGGDLDIKYDSIEDTIYMTGSARKVFDGWIDIS